jgi:hypothetical protein
MSKSHAEIKKKMRKKLHSCASIGETKGSTHEIANAFERVQHHHQLS